MISTALNFMLVGMGGVFLFLFLLVFATDLMHRIAGKLSPTSEEISSQTQNSDASLAKDYEAERIAVAAAAAWHRARGER